MCSWSSSSPQRQSRGSVVQQFGPAGETGCTDWDTGLPITCTEQCAVLATTMARFSLLDAANATGGVKFEFAGIDVT